MDLTKSVKPGVFIGISLIALFWFLISFPTLLSRWQYRYYQDEYQARKFHQAQSLLPILSDISNPDRHMQFQDLMLLAGEAEELNKQYLFLASQHKADETVLSLAARVVQDATLSRQWLQKALSIAPDSQTALIVDAEKKLQYGQALDILPILDRLPDSVPERAYLSAKANGIIGHKDNALQNFQALQASPGYTMQASIEFAEFLAEIKRYDINPFSAWNPVEMQEEPTAWAYQILLNREKIDRQLAHMPAPVLHSPCALAILARAALEQDDIVSARSLLQKASLMRNPIADIIMYKGMLAQREGNRRGAAVLFESGLDTPTPIHSSAFHVRAGYLLMAEGKYELASRHFHQAWNHVPDNGVLLRQVGFSHLTNKQYRQATLVLERAKQVFPKDIRILKSLVSAYGGLQQQEEVKLTLRRILNTQINEIASLDHLARIYVEEGNVTGAISLYNAYRYQFPNSAISYLRVADLYKQQGNPSRAKTILQSALQNNPNLEDRQTVEKMLAELQ
jgi:tetratricopeptide (TPR) repeat protein